ncbi:type II secretion system protein GspD [Rhodothermus marinus]|uniref:Type II and III secretion system protein n=1 Tax=Rhodothermus marinus (strain ATCC 43812 / DSM 4252 / R-10) TaxID=518766 RepID=D0MF16_RHOM4|nr:type II and III secretion system protein [Rhodothermus marinus]ACY47466.1 type II and III secretion system protein [Rhodothermus marinus DSM 4252]
MEPVQTRTWIATALGLLLIGSLLAWPGLSQDRPPQRVMRTYVPPDQLVSFLPTTPLNQFFELLNPIFQRVTGKQIVDPEERTDPIGVSISGMHFFDAFELVLQTKGLTYRETDKFFIIEKAPEKTEVVIGPRRATGEAGAVQAGAVLPATVDTREIQINAILFSVNLTKARDIGINWDQFFGLTTGTGTGTGGTTGGGTSGTGGQNNVEFYLKTEDLFDPLAPLIEAPNRISFRQLTNFLRFLETEGIGETVASPQITVQSGEQGRIQIGSDVPIQTRDFAGNTITQFVSTGIIIDVTPTLLVEPAADTAGAPLIEFVHLDVMVENSSATPSAAGLIIDRNTADTQVLLLDGEQTIIGGLYSTRESISRKGIPFLKDLPWWFFGLRYIFGRTQRTITQSELLIVLQVKVLDPLTARASRPLERNLLERSRRELMERLERFSEQTARQTRMPRN